MHGLATGSECFVLPMYRHIPRECNTSQALMDLGATVCIPKKPKCDECPLRKVCLAFAEVCLLRKIQLLVLLT